jgi:hypothetical protein
LHSLVSSTNGEALIGIQRNVFVKKKLGGRKRPRDSRYQVTNRNLNQNAEGINYVWFFLELEREKDTVDEKVIGYKFKHTSLFETHLRAGTFLV